jgi:hypothetical protein
MAMKAQGEQRYSSTLSLNSSLDGSGLSTSSPGRITTGKQTPYPLYRRLGGLQGRSGRVQKMSHQLGFDPQTVQPVASRNTDWAILVNNYAPQYKKESNVLYVRYFAALIPTYTYLSLDEFQPNSLDTGYVCRTVFRRLPITISFCQPR